MCGKKLLFGMVLFVVGTHCIVPAQSYGQDTATVSIPDTSGYIGTSGNVVSINLDNTELVASMQFTLIFDGNLLAADTAYTTSRTSNMDIAYNTWTDSIKVLLYNMMGDTISSGTGTIVEILLTVDTSVSVEDSVLLNLDGVVLADTLAGAIPSLSIDGWFHFSEVSVEMSSHLPRTYGLSVVSPSTEKAMIRYAIPNSERITLKIYGVSGQLVRTLVNEIQKPGNYTIKWDGKGNTGKEVPTGTYFCKLEAGTFSSTKKLQLIRK